MRRFPLALAGVLFAVRAIAAPESTDAAAVFAQMKTLAGNWTGTFADGRRHGVRFRLTAGDSVVVETWALGNGRESMTLYALDGDRLLATHYCPQGNQPRLVYVGTDAAGHFRFRFLDGANLHVKDRSHQHAFWMAVHDAGSFERAETYVENDPTPEQLAAAEAADAPAVHYARERP